MGTLYYGDNLDILKRYLKDETVDLVYLDPPFKSDANYNAFFKEKDGGAAASQIQAFEDTWHWINKDNESDRTFQQVVDAAPEAVRKLLLAFHDFMGGCDMMAYLMMMAPRLVELRRVLKSTGSLYLHCDPTASHYLKLMLDAVFGKENFSNEIIWKRTTTKNDYKQGAVNWPRVHDVILMYYGSTEAAREAGKFHQPFEPYDEKTIETFYNFKDADHRRYRLSDLTAPGQGSRGHPQYEFKGVTRFWRYNKEKMEKLDAEGRIQFRPTGGVPRLKVYLDDAPGIATGDVWVDVRGMHNLGKEMLGYPTQKPVALLERIINASSNPGDLVLDPFCGCGTTIDAAEKLGRQWIGIDITPVAIATIKKRLLDTYEEKHIPVRFLRASDPESKLNEQVEPGELVVRVIGEPVTHEDAEVMAKEDPYGFQWWVAGLVGARGTEKKKGADSGIDGKILFRDDPKAIASEEIILQVKAGKSGVDHVRDLNGVLTREKAAIGVLITTQPPTRPMEEEAAKAGFYTHKLTGQKYAKLQLRTVKELMAGKGIDRPSSAAATDETFKKAPKAKVKGGEQKALEL